MVADGSQSSPNTRTVRFRIKRQDGPGEPQRWEEFDVPVEPGANVISALQWIAANPVTASGQSHHAGGVGCELSGGGLRRLLDGDQRRGPPELLVPAG